jgi:hypothetical protein
MSDSGKDWGYSSDEQIAQRNKERREAKARKEREQLDELDRLHAASTQGKWVQNSHAVICGERILATASVFRDGSEHVDNTLFIVAIHNA